MPFQNLPPELMYGRVKLVNHLKRILFIFLLAILADSTVLIKRVVPANIPFSCEWIGAIDQVNFNEPSGIVFHPQRKTLFIVGDEGDICEIQRDGTLVKQKRLLHADFEGITCDPSTGLLYIAIEGEEKIIEVDPDDFRVLREFAVNRTFQGKWVLKAGAIWPVFFSGQPPKRCFGIVRCPC